MGNEFPFSHPRWRDNPIGETIGHIEFTDKEKSENKKKTKKIMDRIKKQHDEYVKKSTD